MSSTHFDPFNSRLARDIRNALSKSFLHAIDGKDAAIFQRCVADYLLQEFESVYERYIKNRLKKYEEVFAIMAQGKLEDVLQQAAIFWDYGLYFEMHELLEPVWKMAEGEKRKALQGLIRGAGMKIHAENNNLKAAVSMGAKALVDLAKYGSELAGFAKLRIIEEDIKQTLATAQNKIRQR
jgi:hypothetical protein